MVAAPSSFAAAFLTLPQLGCSAARSNFSGVPRTVFHAGTMGPLEGMEGMVSESSVGPAMAVAAFLPEMGREALQSQHVGDVVVEAHGCSGELRPAGSSEPVSQDWDKAVGKSLKQPNLSARIGVKLLGGAGAPFLNQPNLSARIGVKFLGSAGAPILKQANLPSRIGVKLLGSAGAPFLKQPARIGVKFCWEVCSRPMPENVQLPPSPSHLHCHVRGRRLEVPEGADAHPEPPKAITQAELCGAFDEVTREWSDGVASECAQLWPAESQVHQINHWVHEHDEDGV
eukprot:s3639_g3.t2